MTDMLSKSMRILLVDDNPTNLKVLSECIQGYGWKALMATDGESAIEQTEYAKPDLILLDVMMPGIDGFETCHRLKANPVTEHIPIIFMTALSDTTDKVKGLEIGAVDYITKPFQQEEVIARLKLHLKLSHLTHSLEQTVEQRTVELSESIEKLKQTQLQLIQSEKMSTLGQLVAGIGHEINNPVGFIGANISYIDEYMGDLIRLVELYQEKMGDADEAIEELEEEIDLEYLQQDLPKIIKSVHHGVKRLKDISLSLRTFARADISSKIEFQIHEGIDSTLMLLKHRLKASDKQPEIQVLKQYREIPPVNCYPGQINQALMNLIANAIDAFEECNSDRSFNEIQTNPNTITIITDIDTDSHMDMVVVKIKDNANGMSAQVKERIFDQYFTTKAVGDGTGLGLAITRQIIMDKHDGNLECNSIPGEGTEFIIKLPV